MIIRFSFIRNFIVWNKNAKALADAGISNVRGINICMRNEAFDKYLFKHPHRNRLHLSSSMNSRAKGLKFNIFILKCDNDYIFDYEFIRGEL